MPSHRICSVLLRVSHSVNKCSLIANTPCTSISGRSFACGQFLAAKEHSFNVLPSLPSPITSFRNWMYGLIIKNYLRQEFDLKEFCNVTPLVVKSILQRLADGNDAELAEVVNPKCLKDLKENWERLTVSQKNNLSTLQERDFDCRNPKLFMLMHDASENSKEIPAFLHIRLYVIFFVNREDVNEEVQSNLKKISIPFLNMEDVIKAIPKFPVIHTITLEREVTKGVDDCWKLQNCYNFPFF